MRKYLILLVLVPFLTSCQAQSKLKLDSVAIKDKKIQIGEVVLEKPGFLLVRELTPAGQPGPTVGLTPLLPQGSTKNLVVAIPGVKNETSYRLNLYVDNGDRTFILADESVAMKGKKEFYKDIKNP